MFTIEGIFKNVVKVETGAKRSGDGTWQKTQFVIDTKQTAYNGVVDVQVAFDLWSETINIQPGTPVIVEFSPRSNEYNGRYYTNLVANKLEVAGVQQPQQMQGQYNPQPPFIQQQQLYVQQQQQRRQQYAQQPQANQMPPQAPQMVAPVPKPNQEQKLDDLPF